MVIIFFALLGPRGWPSRSINLGVATKVGSIQPSREVDASGVIQGEPLEHWVLCE